MRRCVIGKPPLLSFFFLVFALSVPFWILGAATGIQLLRGLPIAAMAASCPALAAAYLIYRDRGRQGLYALLVRAFALSRNKAFWVLPALALSPVLMIVTYAIMERAGEPLPSAHVPLSSVVPLLLVFFAGAMAEELGWSGYALVPLQARFGFVGASLLLGAVWSLWHFVPLLEGHRTFSWIAWWALGTVSMRVVMVFLFSATDRSVFAVALFHTSTNLGFYLVPGWAVSYDPAVLGVLFGIIAVMAAFLRTSSIMQPVT